MLIMKQAEIRGGIMHIYGCLSSEKERDSGCK